MRSLFMSSISNLTLSCRMRAGCLRTRSFAKVIAISMSSRRIRYIAMMYLPTKSSRAAMGTETRRRRGNRENGISVSPFFALPLDIVCDDVEASLPSYHTILFIIPVHLAMVPISASSLACAFHIHLPSSCPAVRGVAQ